MIVTVSVDELELYTVIINVPSSFKAILTALLWEMMKRKIYSRYMIVQGWS